MDRAGLVGACHRAECVHNENLECTAASVRVGAGADVADVVDVVDAVDAVVAVDVAGEPDRAAGAVPVPEPAPVPVPVGAERRRVLLRRIGGQET